MRNISGTLEPFKDVKIPTYVHNFTPFNIDCVPCDLNNISFLSAHTVTDMT